MFGRSAARHTVIDEGTGSDFDDKLDDFNPQASSQWDSLAHAGFAADRFYNAATTAQVANGTRNTIENWARKGIVGRAVVIDIDALFGGAGIGFDPGETRRITVADLERARAEAEVRWQPGDIMLMHTGFLRWYLAQDALTRERYGQSNSDLLTGVGLDRGPKMLAYLWDSRLSGVAADNPAVEAMPFDLRPEAWPFGFLHACIIGQLGMALGELWWLADLTDACRSDSRYEVFLTSAPMHVVGGIASPANALAIR